MVMIYLIFSYYILKYKIETIIFYIIKKYRRSMKIKNIDIFISKLYIEQTDIYNIIKNTLFYKFHTNKELIYAVNLWCKYNENALNLY